MVASIVFVIFNDLFRTFNQPFKGKVVGLFKKSSKSHFFVVRFRVTPIFSVYIYFRFFFLALISFYLEVGFGLLCFCLRLVPIEPADIDLGCLKSCFFLFFIRFWTVTAIDHRHLAAFINGWWVAVFWGIPFHN